MNQVLYLYRNNLNSATHTRQYGIPYYLAIINGLIRSDQLMMAYMNKQRGELTSGRVLAQNYFADMANEHYQHFGRRSEPEAVMTEYPFYHEFLAMSQKDVSEKTIQGFYPVNDASANLYVEELFVRSYFYNIARSPELWFNQKKVLKMKFSQKTSIFKGMRVNDKSTISNS